MSTFRVRFNKLELRSCDERLAEEVVVHDRAKIMADLPGGGVYCLAVWRPSKEGHELAFVGRRPLDEPDHHGFWVLATIGQELLDRGALAQASTE